MPYGDFPLWCADSCGLNRRELIVLRQTLEMLSESDNLSIGEQTLIRKALSRRKEWNAEPKPLTLAEVSNSGRMSTG